MGLCISTASRVRCTSGRIGQGVTSGESQLQRYASFSCCDYCLVSKPWPVENSPHTASIHILDDDSLIHVFCLYRPFILGEDEDDKFYLFGGRQEWVHARWWYNLAHVCQRWRNVILGSASYLGVSLVCTCGTPVADMLTHSPPLPLVIDYYHGYRDITEDEGAILALKHRDRVRHVRLLITVTSLKFIAAMDEEYPFLEYLIIGPPDEDRSTVLLLPETLQAPHLRHLTLIGFALPIGSRLLTTAVGLVTLYLRMNDPSTYFHPNALLHWLSFMPQLETLVITFFFPVPNREIERPLTRTPIITLPNLCLLWFRGVSAYLEALVHWITTPRLEKLQIDFFNQLTFSVPRLVQFMNTTENLRFDTAKFLFDDKRVRVEVYPPGEAKMKAAFMTNVFCWHLDWQVPSVAQILNSLGHLFSAVEHLTFEHEVHSQSSEAHNKVDRTEWRKLLRPFGNVKTLWIGNGLVEQLSRSLDLEDGELPLELLPELQELTYSGSGNTSDAFTSFIDAHRNADRAITVVRHNPSTDSFHTIPSEHSERSEPSPITRASSEAGNDFDT